MSDLVKIARKRVSGEPQTHWVGCERDHRECLIQRMADEIERLTACLKKANDQAEHFEREWYLRGDEIERLTAERDDLRSAWSRSNQTARAALAQIEQEKANGRR